MISLEIRSNCRGIVGLRRWGEGLGLDDCGVFVFELEVAVALGGFWLSGLFWVLCFFCGSLGFCFSGVGVFCVCYEGRRNVGFRRFGVGYL